MSIDDNRRLTAEIVAAFVSNNPLPSEELPATIASIYEAMERLGEPPAEEKKKPVPIIPVKKTVTADYLISLEDGQRYKSLKRHLAKRGLTPDEYRQKWGLADNYPMTSANYSQYRSELAKNLGLGFRRKDPPAKQGRGSKKAT